MDRASPTGHAVRLSLPSLFFHGIHPSYFIDLICPLLAVQMYSPSVPVEDPLQARAVFQRSTSINPIQLHFSQFVPITSTENDERWYGTRLVTVILVKHDGRFVFSEKDVWGLDDNGAPTKLDGERRFDGQLSLSGRMDVI